jgi:hypothetical protein
MKLILTAAAALSLLSGCATITRGTTDTLVVNSDPAGAKVQLSTGLQGETPATFKLPRNRPLMVTISKLGYEPQTVQIVPQIGGGGGAGMAGNLVFGGVIGAGVDVASGAMYDLKPNPLFVTLEEEPE